MPKTQAPHRAGQGSQPNSSALERRPAGHPDATTPAGADPVGSTSSAAVQSHQRWTHENARTTPGNGTYLARRNEHGVERERRRRSCGAGLEVTEINIFDDAEAADVVRSVAAGNETVPTVIVGSRALVNPRAGNVLDLVRAEAPHLLTPGSRWSRCVVCQPEGRTLAWVSPLESPVTGQRGVWSSSRADRTVIASVVGSRRASPLGLRRRRREPRRRGAGGVPACFASSR